MDDKLKMNLLKNSFVKKPVKKHFNKNYKPMLVMCILVMLCMTACGKSNNNNENSGDNAISNNTKEVVYISTDTNANSSADTVITADEADATVEEMVSEGIEPDSLDSEILDAYFRAMDKELEHPRFDEVVLHYGLGHVDSDEIPELFINRYSSHIDTITVYKYDPVQKEAVFIGDFGGWGYCHYVPYKNRIISCYGNSGYFFIASARIAEDNAVKLNDVILRDGGFEGLNSYYGFTIPGFNGSVDWEKYDFEKPGRDELVDYHISEEEADLIEGEMREGDIRVDWQTVCVYDYKKSK